MTSISTYLGCFALGTATRSISSAIADKLFLDTINHDENIESTCINLSSQDKEKLLKTLNCEYVQTWELSKIKYFLTYSHFVKAAIHDEIQDAIDNSNENTMDEFVAYFDKLYDSRESQGSSIAYFTTISPLVEEVLFRFIIQKVALGAIFDYAPVSVPVASCARVALSSLAFSALHLMNKYEPSLQRHQLFSTLCGGLIMGVVQEKIGLLGAILVHSGYNFSVIINKL